MGTIRRIYTTYKDEIDEMLEGGIEMGGLVQELNLPEVNIVNVRVDPKKTFQNGLRHFEEVGRERHAY